MSTSTATNEPDRESELGLIAEVLRAGRPAVVVVRGAAGSGKSYVVQRAVAAASADGWRTTRYGSGRGVRVGGGTTADLVVSGTLQSLALPNVPPAGTSQERGLRRLASVLATAAQDRPVLVVFDPYRPSAELAREIRRHLLPQIRSATAQVVLLVVTREDVGADLKPDLDLEVVALDTDAIERSLRLACARLVPAVEAAELQAYVAAARDNPRLLTSLEVVLPLARPLAGHEVSPGTRPADGWS